MTHLLTEEAKQKWEPVLEHESFNKIDNQYRKYVTTVMLEQQSKFLAEAAAPNTVAGDVATWDPVLVSMVRRTTPNLLAFDVAGVQPMNMPTGLIFAMRSRYDNKNGAEAFYNEANTRHTGVPSTYAMADSSGFVPTAAATGLAIDGTPSGYDIAIANDAAVVAGNIVVIGTFAAEIVTAGANDSAGAGFKAVTLNRPTTGLTGTVTVWTPDHILGAGMTTEELEKLGSAGNLGVDWSKMSFTIEKFSVEAKGRAIKGDYSTELATDLRNVHGLNAEAELSNIMSTEIQSEMNREMIRRVNYSAKIANGGNTVDVGGNTDDGRWFIERIKALLLYMDFQANQIAKETRRGKATFALMSSNVAAALSVAGVLDHAPAMSTQLAVDDTGNLFAGVLMGKYKVYIDPYATIDYVTMGYKGTTQYDAGIYWCPYVPLEMFRAVGEDSFQPRIAFKTRYGIASNPFAKGYNQPLSSAEEGLQSGVNVYFRKFKVGGLLGGSWTI